MSDSTLTPEALAEIEQSAHRVRCMVLAAEFAGVFVRLGDLDSLCASLRRAWAERDRLAEEVRALKAERPAEAFEEWRCDTCHSRMPSHTFRCPGKWVKVEPLER
jgi:hypothetical protein